MYDFPDMPFRILLLLLLESSIVAVNLNTVYGVIFAYVDFALLHLETILPLFKFTQMQKI